MHALKSNIALFTSFRLVRNRLCLVVVNGNLIPDKRE